VTHLEIAAQRVAKAHDELDAAYKNLNEFKAALRSRV